MYNCPLNKSPLPPEHPISFLHMNLWDFNCIWKHWAGSGHESWTSELHLGTWSLNPCMKQKPGHCILKRWTGSWCDSRNLQLVTACWNVQLDLDGESCNLELQLGKMCWILMWILKLEIASKTFGSVMTCISWLGSEFWNLELARDMNLDTWSCILKRWAAFWCESWTLELHIAWRSWNSTLKLATRSCSLNWRSAYWYPSWHFKLDLQTLHWILM